MSRARGIAANAPTLARVVAYAALDRVRPPRAASPPAVPPDAAAIDSRWLTAALCAQTPGAEVIAASPDGGSSGTTTRLRLRIDYNDAGREAGLPPTVFTKSTPRLTQRITQAITGPVEARFYMLLRPELDVEAPRCYHGVVDERRMTALTLMEDLVATKRAEFLSPTTNVTRDMAEQVVATLATVHATFAARPRPPYLKTYAGHWADALALVNVERYFLRAFGEAGELIAAPVRREPRRAWDAVLRSIALHERLPATLIHNDVHLGNWYRTDSARLGLCDWQAVVSGHWSRDLAYALSTMLSVETRRAWERELVAAYADALGGVSADEAWDAYRRQLWGALAYWAPTYSPPRLMPADMQPREISGELLRRISTACADLDAFAAVGA